MVISNKDYLLEIGKHNRVTHQILNLHKDKENEMNVNDIEINPNMPASEILRGLFRKAATIPYDRSWAIENNKILGATALKLNDGEMRSFITPDERIGIVIGVANSCLVIHESLDGNVVAIAPQGYELVCNNSGRLEYYYSGIPKHQTNIWFDFIKETDALGIITNESFTAMVKRIRKMLKI